MQQDSWQPAVFFNSAILFVVSVLLAVFCVTLVPSLSSAAELFADFNVSPEEERVWKKASNEDIKTYGRMNESLEQMTIMIPLMSISQGNCDGFRDVDAAAKEGKANDQYVLALAFKFGWCVRKNIRTAARWLAKAAEAGSRHAQEGLGLLLLKGDGEITADPHSAADHLRKAAENGMENSQYALALMYTDGTGVPQDIKFAHRWLEKAATKGHEKAIFKLAMLFFEGSGVERSVSKATDWLLFGAQRGSVICQYSAARVLATSNKKQDHIQAHMWVNLAAAKNSLSKLTEMITKLRSDIEAVLSPQEIAHAQQLARNWKLDENEKPPNYQEPEQETPPALPDDPTATTEQITARNELITRGIPITRFAFFGAIQKDDLELVKLFRKAGASLEAVALGAGDGPTGVSPLYVSVDWGALKVYRYLMDHGVNIVNAGVKPVQ
jgi:TPR repeat protein